MSNKSDSKGTQAISSVGTHPDGHVLLEGARWHWPKKGSPTECGVPGCERTLRVSRSDAEWIDDQPEPDTTDVEPDLDTQEIDAA